jgi:Spy/CpxP family protein refolding chaperone
MSLKNKFISILTIAVGIVVFSTFTLAQDEKAVTTTPEKIEKRMKGEGHDMGKRKAGREGFGGRHHGMRGKLMRGIHGLNLTDAQKEQVRSIMQANKPDEATITELRAIRESRKAGTEITPEQKERLKALREQGREKAKSVHEQILGVLTAEQKAQIETRKTEMKQRFEQHKQMRQQKPSTTTEKPKIN